MKRLLIGIAALIAAVSVAGFIGLGSAKASDPSLFSGTISGSGTTSSGGVVTRMVGGDQIDLFLDPAEGGGMAVGDTASMTFLSTTTTAADGSYTLTAPVNTATTNAANNNGGYVNFLEVVTSPNGTMTEETFSGQLLSGAWRVGAAATEDLTPPDTTLSGNLTDTVSNPNNGCHIPPKTTVLASGNAWTTIGEVHTANNQTDDIQYGHLGHANSNIGVGFSTDNVHFSADGTNYRSESASVNWPQVGSQVGQRATSSFKYQHVKVYYPCQGVTHYFKKSVEWNGGDNWGTDNHSLDNNCSGSGNTVSFLAGSGFIKDTGQGVLWSGGASFFGFTATTRQGWSSDNRSYWRFGTQYKNYYLCGDNNTPVNAQRVFAGL